METDRNRIELERKPTGNKNGIKTQTEQKEYIRSESQWSWNDKDRQRVQTQINISFCITIYAINFIFPCVEIYDLR